MNVDDCFFYRSEVGKRDAQESRGLGEVYKRHADNRTVGALNPDEPARLCTNLDLTHAQAIIATACVQMPPLASVTRIQDPVAYTHLTLPTIREL